MKSNPGIPVQGQINLVEEIEQNLAVLQNLLRWSGPSPSYEQLRTVLDLAWRHLRTVSGGEHNIHSANQLTYVARNYARIQSVAAMIQEDLGSNWWIEREPDFGKRVNRVVFSNLDIARHWYDFKLPKLLSAVSVLHGYVFDRHNYDKGDYALFAGLLERGNFSPNVAILLDYNVPPSAVTKISRYVDREATPESVLAMLAEVNLESFHLIPYEIKRVNAIRGLSA